MKTCSSINLYENGNLISKESQVAEVLNEHFVNITDSLGIVENKDIITPTIGIEDPVEVAVKKFESHPSILKIRRHTEGTQQAPKSLSFAQSLKMRRTPNWES